MGERGWINRIGPWLLAAVVFALVAGGPLVLVAWLTTDPPEVRIVATGRYLSALIVDDDARLLVVRSDDRGELRSALGRLAWPWEPEPDALIAANDDRTAVGLLEALRHTAPRYVLVAGIPGADPIWSQIEHLCESRQVDLRYVSSAATISTGRLSITVFGTDPDQEGPIDVVVRHDGVNIAIALDDDVVELDAQIVVSNGDTRGAHAAVSIVGSGASPNPAYEQVVASNRDVVTVRLEHRRVRIIHGQLRRAASTPSVVREGE